MDENIGNEAQETEFNASVATLMRIDELKKMIDFHLYHEQYIQFFRALVPYYSELHPILNDKDRLEQSEKFNLFIQKFNEIKTAIKHKRKKIPNHTESIVKWHLNLRELEQKYGLNMPKKGDARWAMARR